MKLRCLFFLLILLAAGRPAAGQSDIVPPASQQINPPFGLEWGETSDRLEKLLKGAKADIVDRHDIAGRQAWTVEGLIQTGLKRTDINYKENHLVEVELQ